MQNNTFSPLFIGQNIVKLTEVDSTNNYLKNTLSNYEPLAEGTVIMADKQFAGRGQRESKWLAEPGKNLTVSIYLCPNFLAAKDQFRLNKMVSLSVLDLAKHYLGENCKIKWPNDIYIGKKKIGGILIENTIKGNYLKNSVIGIGLNINQENFEDLEKASSFYHFLNQETHLSLVLNNLCYFLEKRYLKLKSNDIDDLDKEYLSSLYQINTKANYKIASEIVEGEIKGVTETGALIVEIQKESREFDIKGIEFI